MFFHPFLFSCYRYVGKLNVVPQVSEALCIFLWSFFLFSSDWLISFELPSTVLLFSCVGANLRLNPSSKLFVSFIVLFKVRISSWLLFYTLYLSFLRFSICWLTIFSFFKQDFLPFFECVCVCVCVLAAQSCPTLCSPMDCGPPGSSVPGILQARTLEWAAMPFSRGSSRPRHWTEVSTALQTASLPSGPAGRHTLTQHLAALKPWPVKAGVWGTAGSFYWLFVSPPQDGSCFLVSFPVSKLFVEYLTVQTMGSSNTGFWLLSAQALFL